MVKVQLLKVLSKNCRPAQASLHPKEVQKEQGDLHHCLSFRVVKKRYCFDELKSNKVSCCDKLENNNLLTNAILAIN